MQKETYAILKNLTNKKNIKLVSRGNKAILYALRIAKKLGKTQVLIQDQGGWITYKQFSKKLKLDLIELKTDYGLINTKELEKNINKNSVLLINSLTGYFAQQDMDTIYSICSKKECLVINDISGSIGTEAAKVGDILVCSFGNDKPLDYGKGGLIAAKEELLELTEIKEENLGNDFYKTLKNLEKRLSKLKKLNKKIKSDLKKLEIIHKAREGINVIVKFNNEREKKEIEEYCNKNNYQYTVCPRYIRVNCDAISIEVKRL